MAEPKVKIDLAPGKYRLKTTVTNPKADKRKMKSDWRCQPEWPEGMKLVVTEKDLGDKDRPLIIHEVYKYGGWQHMTLPVRAVREKDDIDALRFAALLPHLEPITTENLGDIFTGKNNVEPHCAPELLAILMDMGKIKFEDVRRAADTLQEMDEETWHELRKKHFLTYKD